MEKNENSGEINLWQEIKAIAPTILALVAVLFSWWTFEKLLPLSQSNIIFSENSIIIHPNQESKEDGRFDVISPLFKNVGKVPAYNLFVQVYGIPFSENVTWDSGKKVERYFSSQLIHALDPESSASFGSFRVFHFPQDKNGKSIDLAKNSERFAIIFCLAYHDLLEERKASQRMFYFQYVIGTPFLSSLTSDDFEKIRPRLVEQLNKEGDTICRTDDNMKEGVQVYKSFPTILRREKKPKATDMQAGNFSKWLIESSRSNTPLFKI